MASAWPGLDKRLRGAVESQARVEAEEVPPDNRHFQDQAGPVFWSIPMPAWQTEDRGYGSPCWIWTGKATQGGYGLVWGRIAGKATATTAHRWMWQVWHGPLPPGHEFEVDHLCRVQLCVRPSHLEPVSPYVNHHRNPNASANKTHCPHGHPYDTSNTTVRPDGARICRTCARESQSTYEKRLRQRLRQQRTAATQ
jgi:hypothetical protein